MVEIESVAEYKKSYFQPFKTFMVTLLLLVLGFIVVLNVISYIGYTYSSPWAYKLIDELMGQGPLATLLEYLIGLIFFIGLFWYIYVDIGAGKKFMENAGESLGLVYTPNASIHSVSGSLFESGSNPVISNVLSGSYKDVPLRIYNFETERGGNRTPAVFTYSVCEFTFPFELPYVLLVHAKDEMFGMTTGVTISGGTTLQLEGDFNKYYRLSSVKGFENEVLQILTPDVMQGVIGEYGKVMLEMDGKKLYIFQKGIVSSQETLLSLHETATRILQMLAPRLKEASKSVSVMKSYIAK